MQIGDNMNKYLVVSCETSGFSDTDRDLTIGENGKKYVALSLGLVVTDLKFNIIDQLYLELYYPDSSNIAWDADAIKIHRLSPQHLEENGIPCEEAVGDIANFLFDHFDVQVITVAGHNINSFVLPFFEDFLTSNELPFKFSVNKIDLSTLGHVLLGANSKQDIYAVLGVKSVKRNALIDAKNTAKCLHQIKKMWETML